MVRYLVAAAGALAMMSGIAFAHTATSGATTTTITRAAPQGVGYKKAVVKRHVNRRGYLVTKKRVVTNGISGSSVTQTRTTTDPYAGGTVTQSRTTTSR